MKIAIIGYGKMGREIEYEALQRGHTISLIVDKDDENKLNIENMKDVDVAIEFSTPESAYKNIMQCFHANVPVVCGTTGWLAKKEEIISQCNDHGKTFFYASNYSLGVNLFFRLNEILAKMLNDHKAYDVYIEETHHTQKLDAPSGTAITLADGIINSLDRKESWVNDYSTNQDELIIRSFREGTVPGNHKVIYESEFDTIKIEHDAKNRKGFALGAVMAAEFIAGKHGYFTMNDLLKL